MTQLLAIVVLVILGIGLALADPLNNGPKGMSAGLLNHSTASAYMYNGTSGGKTTYTVWCVDVGGVGCEKDVATESKPGVVLMGGGTDTDEAFLRRSRRLTAEISLFSEPPETMHTTNGSWICPLRRV